MAKTIRYSTQIIYLILFKFSFSFMLKYFIDFGDIFTIKKLLIIDFQQTDIS